MGRLSLTLFVFLWFAPAAALADDCPLDSLHLYDPDAGSPIRVTLDSTHRVELVLGHPDIGWSAQEIAEYDLASGTMHVMAKGLSPQLELCGGAWANAYLRDVYTLEGPSGNEPITFNARFDLTMSATGEYTYQPVFGGPVTLPPGWARFSCAEGASNVSTVLLDEEAVGWQGSSVLTLTRAPGESFELSMRSSVWASSTWVTATDHCVLRVGEISANLSFPDLPPGYGIVSCQGFRSGTSVPVNRPTWGQIKTLYR